jgi:heme-degrading monooxygenase HmoA
MAGPQPDNARMDTSTFTFAKGAYDHAFHALDATIAQVAQSIPGYLGEEAWENAATGLISNVYYWENKESLEALMQHPSHLAAKTRQGEWLAGYHVVIAEVMGSYGDGKIGHPLAKAGRERSLSRRFPVTSSPE